MKLFPLILFLSSQLPFAPDFEVGIDGPTTVKAGYLTEFIATGNGERFTWEVVGVERDCWRISETGRRLYYSSPEVPAQPISVLLTSALISDDGKLHLETVRKDVKIVPHVVKPTPKPDTPKPDTPKPDEPVEPEQPISDRYGLASYTKVTITKHLTDDQLELCPKFGTAFKSIAKKIKDKTITDSKTAYNTLKANLHTIKPPADNPDAPGIWTLLMADIMMQMNNLRENRQMQTMDDLAQAFLEVGKGFSQ